MKFEEMAALMEELDAALLLQVPSLSAYFAGGREPGFSHLGGGNKQSKASTATCVTSLLSTDRWHRDWVARDAPRTPWADDAERMGRTLLFGPWESSGLSPENVFTTSFILEASSKLLTGTKDDRVVSQVRKAQSAILKGPSKRGPDLFEGLTKGAARVYKYRQSAFLTQVAIRALKASSMVPGAALPNIEKKLSKARDWARGELSEQLALRQSGSRNHDSFEMAYAAVVLVGLTKEGVSPSEAVLVRAALSGFFESQLPNGSWPRSLPLFHYPDVGAAFCYEYELLVDLLECAALRNELMPFLPKLALAARHAFQTGIPIGSSQGRGWPSGHHRHILEPESWSTASVYHFFQSLTRLLSEAMRQQAFRDFGQSYSPPGDRKTPFAAKMLDCPLKVDRIGLGLKRTLEEKFAAPLVSELEQVSRGRPFSKTTPTSALLYGPPGTSKTDLAENIASFLGWPLLKVDPSHLVKSGMDRIQAEADSLFKILSRLEQVVVLLDEVDELVRDRGTATELQSRFLTTSMLPKLTALQTRRRIVWLAATNYLESFDLAIRRRGRFDLVVQVLPPTSKAKCEFWPELESFVNRSEDPATVMSELALLTFAETKSLVQELQRTSSRDRKGSRFEAAVKESTMKSHDGHGKGSKESWLEVCREQADKQRWTL